MIRDQIDALSMVSDFSEQMGRGLGAVRCLFISCLSSLID